MEVCFQGKTHQSQQIYGFAPLQTETVIFIKASLEAHVWVHR